MSALVKTKLKAAREAIGKKDWAAAQTAAATALEYEPDNYNANVFLGLASLELGHFDQSEQAYRKAIAAGPEQALAWQGLNKFYERSEKWDGYGETLQKLMHLHSNANDASKCAETVQRFVELQRQHGSSQQVIDALSLYLHSSPLYPVLSQLPPPDLTNPTATTTFDAQSAINNSLPVLEEIVLITERDETKLIESEVGKRRQRLGAPPPEQIRKDVDQEVLGSSKLPALYEEISNHPSTTDELRRSTEGKLLRLKMRHLNALSASKAPELKVSVRKEVDSLIEGMVLLDIPDELAWSVRIESTDAETIDDYDYALLRRYIALFPSAPLSKLVSAYFMLSSVPLGDEADDDSKRPQPPVDADEKFYEMLDVFVDTQSSTLAHRILAELYLQQEDYENAIKVAESGLELVRRTESDSGKKISLTRKAFNVILGTSLVHLNAPKHHTRALRIVDDVLDVDPSNILCLMGRGYILQHSKRWPEARELFERVAELLPDDLDDGLRAREEEAWCKLQMDEAEVAQEALKDVLVTLDSLEGRNEDKARCWWRYGRSHWALGGENIDEAYKAFITALKHSPTFAPAFSSLGVYYADHANPPDPGRASKCFQKAFELDPREAGAARRLAEGFAEEREWDLVDVVARRTIEGEGGADATAAAKSKYLPVNAWAWKAVGAVELHRRNYVPAIHAYQTALRADPDDQVSWLRLGEGYSKAGRYAAAVKALGRAQELDPSDWMCNYFMGEVLRQTGQFAEAIAAFTLILETRPGELGALMALAQTRLDLGRAEELAGFAARAEASCIAAIGTAMEAMAGSPGFRRMAWKVVGDALFSLAQRATFALEDEVRAALNTCLDALGSESSPRVKELFTVELSQGGSDSPLKGKAALELAITAYEYRRSLGSKDDPSYSSSWADLAVALHTWARTATDAAKRSFAEKEAIDAITTAIRADPGNDALWVTLGDIQFEKSPKAAQHAYIRALEIDKTNAAVWTHLGLLYLHHDDLQLANEALLRAQTLDPDFTLAWVGQALVAAGNKHEADAKTLLEHAVSLPSDVPAADLEYAARLLTRLDAAGDVTPEALLPAFFALDRYTRRRSDDACATHLFALVCERLGHLALGSTLAARAIGLVEAAYELTEDAALERPFAIANASAGRIALGQGEHARALEAFESALGLLPEPESGADIEDARLRALCHFGAGLAHGGLGQPTEALEALEAARVATAQDAAMTGHVTVLIAQTLWSLGTDDARESAKSQLLQCIAADPENLAAITALAGMGIVTADDALVDAALSEIVSLPVARRVALDPGRDVTYLLAQHALAQGDLEGARIVYRDALAADPSSAVLRRQLAALTLQCGDAAGALELVRAGAADETLEETREAAGLHAVAASVAAAGNTPETARLAQRAVMLTPWAAQNWEALAFVRSQPAVEPPPEDHDGASPGATVPE